MNRMKKGGAIIAIALSICVFSWAPASADDIADWVAQAFSHISAEAILQDAQILTGQIPSPSGTIETRHIGQPDHQKAIDYLVSRIEELGFEPSIESFPCSSDDCSNLVVDIAGSDTPEKIWIVGAHFDSTNGVDADGPAQGAVDNASGVIIVLQTLDAMADFEFSDSLRFILFDAEEEGLLGSQYHAEQAAERGDDIELMINLDVAGWRSGEINMAFANSDSNTWPNLKDMMKTSTDYECGTQLLGVPTDLIDTADMASFWDQGYRGLMVGSLYALTGYMNTAQDTYEKLDQEQCANVSRIVAAYLIEFAGAIGPIQSDDDTTGDDDTSDDDLSDDDAQGDDDSSITDDDQSQSGPQADESSDGNSGCGC